MESSSESIISELEFLLANSYALYFKTQSYHWNITGSDFITLHKLFEEQYLDLAEAIDQIAERIRMLGSIVSCTLASMHKQTTIKDPKENNSADQMLAELLVDQQEMIKNCQKSLQQISQLNDTTTSDLLTSRIATHEKNCWILKSIA